MIPNVEEAAGGSSLRDGHHYFYSEKLVANSDGNINIDFNYDTL